MRKSPRGSGWLPLYNSPRLPAALAAWISALGLGGLWRDVRAEAPVTPQVDLHLDTPTQLFLRRLPLDAPAGLEAGLSALRAGGTNLPVMVLWPGDRGDPKTRTFDLLKTMEGEIARLPDVVLVRSPTEARAAVAAGQTGVLLSIEGAQGLGEGEGWTSALAELHSRGLSLLGLTWSHSNRFAGSSGDQGGGLTGEGKVLVEDARRMRIVVDVSHASRLATMEVCANSSVPVIASHSDAHGVTAANRNLTDPEIACICKTGGVIGLNFHATFVGPGANAAKVADHADHIAGVGGRACLAIGSDFDGYIKKPADLRTEADLPVLLAELRSRGWTEAELDGLRGGNFLRAWEAVTAVR